MSKLTECKQTEIGEIPKDWNIAYLGDSKLADLIMGQSPPSATYNKAEKGLPFLQGNAEFGDKYPKPALYCSEPIKIAEKGDILISVRAPVGDINIAETKLCIGRGLAAIRPKVNILHNDFLYYHLRHNRSSFERLSAGSTFKAIRRNEFDLYNIPLPSLPEQYKIAEILSTMDEAIEKVDQAIEKTERLKKGLMQELLTKGIGHKEFKDTEIGRIPKEWEVVKLGDIGNLQYGFTASAKQNDTGIKFLRITDIKDDGLINWVQVPYCEINESDFEKNKLNKGDILFARIGSTTGKTCYIDKQVKGVFASYLIRFQGESNIDTKFLYYYTQSTIYWLQANKHKEGQLKKGLNATVLSNLKLQLPSLPEQINIVDILSGVDERLVLLKQKKLEFERIKKGLMNDLLIGRKRVVI